VTRIGHRTRCEHCGWTGNTAECVLYRDYWSDDADLECPSCGRVFLADDMDEGPIIGKHSGTPVTGRGGGQCR